MRSGEVCKERRKGQGAYGFGLVQGRGVTEFSRHRPPVGRGRRTMVLKDQLFCTAARGRIAIPNGVMQVS